MNHDENKVFSYQVVARICAQFTRLAKACDTEFDWQHC
jgi:hypothetical protein